MQERCSFGTMSRQWSSFVTFDFIYYLFYRKDICYIFFELIYISIKRKDGVRYHQPVFFRAPTLLSRPISVKQGI